MRRMTATLGMLGLIAALTLSACGSADDGTTTIRYGSVGGMTDAPLYIAEKRGYFEEVGITVERTRFESGAQILAALVGGSLDVGAVPVSAGLLSAVDGSDKFRFVADRHSQQGPGRFGFGFLAKTELLNGVSIEDKEALGQMLKGKTVAITGKSASTEFIVDELMKTYGIDSTQVKLVVLPFASMAAAFKSGAIDAAVVLEPFMSQILESKSAVMISHLDGVISSGTQVPVTYTKSFVEGDKAAAEGFLHAFLRGVQDMNDALAGSGKDKDDIVKIISEYTDLPEEVIAKCDPPGMDPTKPLDISYMEDFQDFLYQKGAIKKKVDIASAVDDSFAAEARKKLNMGAS